MRKDRHNQDQLIIKLSKGNKAAFEELFNYYYPRLYNFSIKFLKLEDGIDDILQEAFIRIWENRKNIHSSNTFNSYIFTITKNLLLNELRSRLNNNKIKDKIFKLSVSKEYTIIQDIEYNDLTEKVDQIIEIMPSKTKTVYELSRKEGLSNKEIAKKLEISPKTVEYHISQSIKFLKDKLKELGLISLLYFYLFL
jgi:RNA polymerase sigma-70 factor, ECF subfamily